MSKKILGQTLDKFFLHRIREIALVFRHKDYSDLIKQACEKEQDFCGTEPIQDALDPVVTLDVPSILVIRNLIRLISYYG